MKFSLSCIQVIEMDLWVKSQARVTLKNAVHLQTDEVQMMTSTMICEYNSCSTLAAHVVPPSYVIKVLKIGSDAINNGCM